MRFARYALLVVAVIGLVGSLGYIIYVPATPPAPEALVTLVADNLDGSEFAFADYGGQILVIDFWATWCGPCITEIPHYNALYADYKDQGVSLIGLTVESGTAEEVLEWMASDEKFQMNYPLVMANDELIDVFGPIFGFPTTLLIDPQGNVIKRWIGASVGKSDQIRELIDQMLAGEQLEGTPIAPLETEETIPVVDSGGSS